jgi:hypothetical protein
MFSVAEAGSIMSLAPSGARGKYLALWIVARNVSHPFFTEIDADSSAWSTSWRSYQVSPPP